MKKQTYSVFRAYLSHRHACTTDLNIWSNVWLNVWLYICRSINWPNNCISHDFNAILSSQRQNREHCHHTKCVAAVTSIKDMNRRKWVCITCHWSYSWDVNWSGHYNMNTFVAVIHTLILLPLFIIPHASIPNTLSFSFYVLL